MNYKEKYYKELGLDKCDVLYCAVCGAVANNLHHLTYKSQKGTDKPENLLPLCYVCHDKHHTQNIPTTKELKKLKLLTNPPF